MGFLGILEDKYRRHVPATVTLDQENARTEGETAGLKHGTGRESHIILVPQPTDDPNDPLNWPNLKKRILVTVISFGGIIMAGVYSSLLNPALGAIAIDLNRSINDIAVLSGYTLLSAGAIGFIVAACSRKWGKRPVFFLSSLLGTVGSIVGASALSYKGLLASRIIQGVATATYESVLVTTIGDLYFVHQRGVYMAVIQFILGGVSNLAGVICGSIADSLGWPWLFRLCVIFSGIQTILVFFLVPETSYRRVSRQKIPHADKSLGVVPSEKKRADQACHHLELCEQSAEKTNTIETATASPLSSGSPPKKTFVQELVLFNGTFCDEGWIQLLIAPFTVCLNLAILWSVVLSGGSTALYVSQALGMAQIFQAPPYNLSVASIGYLSLGPFIGALTGSIIMSIINDPIIKWCAIKNNGIYEPEYRLIPAAGALLMGTGLMGFGALAQEGRTYYATATMHGLTLAGVVIVATAVGGYALDAYEDLNDDVFVSMIIFKNFLFYGFSWFVNDWITDFGPARVFYVLGGIGFCMIITVPVMFIFGKRYRSYWSRNNLLKKFHIQSRHQ